MKVIPAKLSERELKRRKEIPGGGEGEPSDAKTAWQGQGEGCWHMG